MLPNIRVEQYEIKNHGTFDGAKWLTKYDVKIQFSDRDIAYAMKDRIDKFLQGEDYRAMYLKVRDELAELQQRTWVGLAKEDRLCAKYMQDAPDGIEAVIDYIESKLKELNT